jgi:hypothetical protein
LIAFFSESRHFFEWKKYYFSLYHSNADPEKEGRRFASVPDRRDLCFDLLSQLDAHIVYGGFRHRTLRQLVV